MRYLDEADIVKVLTFVCTQKLHGRIGHIGSIEITQAVQRQYIYYRKVIHVAGIPDVVIGSAKGHGGVGQKEMEITYYLTACPPTFHNKRLMRWLYALC